MQRPVACSQNVLNSPGLGEEEWHATSQALPPRHCLPGPIVPALRGVDGLISLLSEGDWSLLTPLKWVEQDVDLLAPEIQPPPTVVSDHSPLGMSRGALVGIAVPAWWRF